MMKRHNMASGFVNPEYYERYENCEYGAYDTFEDLASKKRKLMNMTVCVDHLRGYCPKGARCPKAHSDQVHSLDEREVMAKAKFCHDFQNRGLCSRGTCRFLHVTRREEDEFLLTGVIPKSVFQRRAQEEPGNDGNPNYSNFSNPPPRGGAEHGRGTSGMMRSGRGPPGGGYPSPYPPSSYYGTPYDYYDYGGGNWGTDWDVPYSAGGNSRGSSSANKSHTVRSVSQALTFGNYCIDFLKGTCTKGSNCRLSHVNDVEDMDDREAIVKNIFCHDFQNKRCPRIHCKYIHADFDEQKIFIEEGYFSESLRNRNRSKLFFCDICIDFLRKQCFRGSNCQYRHVSCVEEEMERICLSRSIFCRDHQEGGCIRSVCKLMHTAKADEVYFMDTGYLPDHLRDGGGGGGTSSLSSANNQPPPMEVCRDFLKGLCNRGNSCKFHHPGQSSHTNNNNTRGGGGGGRGGGGGGQGGGGRGGISQEDFDKLREEYEKVKEENNNMKQRIQQLEQLLADACHCITLALGDQNPTIKPLLDSIAGMAPTSNLAVKTELQ